MPSMLPLWMEQVLMTFIDPRENIEHLIQAGQMYVDSRTDTHLHLVYMDDEVVLLKDQDRGGNRLEQLKSFKKAVGAGRFKLTGDVETPGEIAESESAIDFTQVDGVGQTTATSLIRAGFRLPRDIKRADRDELLAIRGVGEGNLQNIKEYIE